VEDKVAKKKEEGSQRSSKIELRRLAETIEGLKALGPTGLPLWLAFRIAEGREALEAELRKYNQVLNTLIEKYQTTDERTKTKGIKPGTQEWDDFTKERKEADERIITVPLRLTLYTKGEGKKQEYSWYKDVDPPIKKLDDSNIIFGILPLTDVIRVDADES